MGPPGVPQAAQLGTVRWGLILSLLTLAFGFGLGGLFGGLEANLKDDLASRALAVRDSVYGGDEDRMKTAVDRGWVYYKRAHLHGGGIGAAAFGGCLLLALLRSPGTRARRIASLALGAGALGYSVFWLLAGARTPRLGSTTAARESLNWLAIPASGLLLGGLACVLVLTVRELFLYPGTRR